ncbi:MAG: HPr family phosphocarrier protein [Verrucomicrobiae bacterium]|nr:HPr family phosphocarrier protein [Verrucomicrobiae bacterium]
MTRAEITIAWSRGLHLRRAAELVRLAQRFSSQISVQVDSRMADAKSVLSLMLLSAGLGTALTIEAMGADEAEAMHAVQQFFSELSVGES